MLDDEEKLLKLHENLGDVRVLMGKSEDAVESFRKACELTRPSLTSLSSAPSVSLTYRIIWAAVRSILPKPMVGPKPK